MFRPFSRAAGLGLLALSLCAGTLAASTEKATFAGGCFWCMEDAFEELHGVVLVTSGYTGGPVKNPTYEQVGTGRTGHIESIQVVFDPTKVTYKKLLDTYWANIDPLNPNGQFCDRGDEYRAVIFFHGDEQRRIAEASRDRIEQQLHQKVATQIRPASEFYPAETYHQGYARKNPYQYGLYRKGCGRDDLLKQIWGVTPLEEQGKP